jgi:tungstate transport system substrate-binding protein
MAATLGATTERQAYTLAERQAFLERRDLLDLDVAFDGDPDLLRLFHVIAVNPARGPWIDGEGARAFADSVVGPEAQQAIGQFGVERYGQPAFTPDAGRTEDELVPANRAAR